MGSRKTHEGAEAVYAAAQKWVDCALRSDDSLFTPGKPIWSSRWLKDLRERFLDRPDVPGDDFMQKLERQLADSPAEVYQLAAEALYVHFLMVWRTTMGGDAKEAQVNQVLGWSAQDLAIPHDLVAGLTPGIASSQAFNMYRPYHVGFLAEFVEQWKEQASSERQRLLDDPWAFKGFVTGLRFRSKLLRIHSNAHRVQREALYHLAFPDNFESIVGFERKMKITEAFADRVTEPTDDVDRKLAQIRRGLEASGRKDVSFDDPDIRVQWDPDFKPWDEFIGRAQEITPENFKDDFDPKLKVTRRLKEVREAVLSEQPGWPELVKNRGITSAPFPIIPVFCQIKLRDWIDNSPDEALGALQAIWEDRPLSVSERIKAFCEKFPREVVGGAGQRTTVASQFLMAVDVERYPPYRTQAFMQTYERTRYGRPAKGASEAALYEHGLGFLDQLMREAKDRGLELPNRLRAQSVLWILFWPRHHGGDAPLEDDDDMEESDWRPAEPADLPALADKLHLPVSFLKEIEALLDDKKQVIFQGPPGTGKTYVAQKLARHLAGSDERVTLVQLHPSYAYEDFVQGFRPTLKDGQPGFELRDGPLLRAANLARQAPDEKHFLVIDEINRGNLAKVLGELYFLLEYRDKEIRLQYSDEPFSLPSNLYFIGTMNTADRSIALVDLALRRRFYFVEFHPDDEPVKGVLRRWIGENAPGMEWVADVVERANVLLQEDRHAAIGPSYFMKDGLDETAVERIWKHSVLSYIEERLFGEGDRLGQFDLNALRRATGGGSAQDEEQAGDAAGEGGTE